MDTRTSTAGRATDEPTAAGAATAGEELTAGAELAAFVAALPKAELHVHLEGSLEPEMMLAMAKRNRFELPWSSTEALRDAYEFEDLQSFLDLYYAGTRVLQTRQDFYDLTWAYLERARAEGVVRAEMFSGPQSFMERGLPIAEVMEGILSAVDDGRRAGGMSAGLILVAQRHRSQADALALLDAIQPWGDRILGFGLAGAEVGNPPSKFVDFLGECRRQGFELTAHAGEEGPAAYVREALDLLRLGRIDHGIAAVDDPELVADLASRSVTLTVCPVSNLKLKCVTSLADHPLPELLRAGVRVTVNSDDPAYFGAYLNENLLRSAVQMRLTKTDLVTLARNSFLGAFLPPDQIAGHVDHLERVAGELL